MKYFLAFSFLLTSLTSFAQSHAIKINPLSIFLATGNISYEKKLSENQSFQLGVFYMGIKANDIKYSGIGITPEYRFYFAGAKKALDGVYAAPYLRYQNYALKEAEDGPDSEYKFTSIGGGGVIGWQKAYTSGFVLNMFVGLGYNSGKYSEGSEDKDRELLFGLDRFGTRAGLTLGFWF